MGVLGFGVYYSYVQYDQLKSADVKFLTLAKQFTFDFAQYLQSYEVWLAFLIILAVLLLIFMVLILFFCKRIRIATRLIGEGSKVLYRFKITIIKIL